MHVLKKKEWPLVLKKAKLDLNINFTKERNNVCFALFILQPLGLIILFDQTLLNFLKKILPIILGSNFVIDL